jgi:hypothetical protein
MEEIIKLVEYVESKGDTPIQIVRTHQHHTTHQHITTQHNTTHQHNTTPRLFQTVNNWNENVQRKITQWLRA